MIARSYKFKFYLNARHVLNLQNGRPIVHPHTWELTMLLVKEREGFVQFGQIETRIVDFLSAYENTLLNTHPAFKDIEPSTEAIGEVFYKRLNQDLMDIGWKITSIDVSENPARTYSIEDKSYHFNGFNPFADLKVNLNDGNVGWKKAEEQPTVWKQDDEPGTKDEGGVEKASIELLLEEFRALAETVRLERLAWSEAHPEQPDGGGCVLPDPLEAMPSETCDELNETPLQSVNRRIGEYLEKREVAEDRSEPPQSVAIPESPAVMASVSEGILGDGKALVSAVNAPAGKPSQALEEDALCADAAPAAPEPHPAKTKEKTVWEHVTGYRLTISFWHVFTALSYAGILGALYLWIYRTGQYPWGSDTWGHLFKGHFLYEEVSRGNFYPLYTSLWYNGIQPFRYWAPIPYYFLLALELFTGGDSLKVYNLFIGSVFLAGAVPWIMMGRRYNRPYLGTVLGIIWFILPDNLRVFFCEGNIPRVVVTTLFPYLLLSVLTYLETRKRGALIAVYFLMLMMTLSHAMISAMTGITLFLFLVCYGFVYREVKAPVMILTSALLGIITSGVWLYPALKGGIVSLDSAAASAVMERLTYHISQSLNPLMRMDSNLSDGFYFGIAILLISLLGMLSGDRFSKILFGMTVLIFVGTTKTMLPIIRKLPMNDLFWMMRFTPMAMAFFLAGLLRWESLKKYALKAFIVLVILEGVITLNLVDLSLPSSRLFQDIQDAGKLSVQRIAMLDLSTFDSDPSFGITYNNGDKRLRQTFGWAWQGASTADNMVWVNTALTKGYYPYVFDRCLELGADTLMVKKALIKDRSELIRSAAAAGYRYVKAGESVYIFQYPAHGRFATKAEYRGLAIGSYASNITYAFPSIQAAEEPYLDAYSLEELSQYSTVFLSGFKYKSKERAEELVHDLGKRGVRVVIDLAGQENDLLSGRAEFLGVMGEPIQFKGKLPKLVTNAGAYYLENLPKELSQWNTSHLVNLDNSLGRAEFEQDQYDFWGSKDSDNIVFVGFNLPYYLSEVNDRRAVDVMEQILGIKADISPARRAVDVKERWATPNELVLAAPKGTLLDVAALDAFETVGAYEIVHNLVKMKDKALTIRVTYPYLQQGLIISAAGVIGFLGFIWLAPFEAYRGQRRRSAEEAPDA